jgi:hypothetical protein
MRRPLAPVAVIAWLAGAGCGGPPAAPPITNTPAESLAAQDVVVDTHGPLGWLAFPAATDRAGDVPHWIAITREASAVVPSPPPSPLAAGATYRAIPADGHPAVDLVAGAPITIGYGCDRTPLDVIPLAGAPVPPGLVWVVPTPVPSTWQPSVRTLLLRIDTPARRRWSAGELDLDLEREDDRHARLRISRGGRLVHDEHAEAYEMDGAPPISIDLSAGERTPGVPYPEAVFAFGVGGPFLVVLDRSGYEGVAFETVLVGFHGEARPIDTLRLAAYHCAF